MQPSASAAYTLETTASPPDFGLLAVTSPIEQRLSQPPFALAGRRMCRAGLRPTCFSPMLSAARCLREQDKQVACARREWQVAECRMLQCSPNADSPMSLACCDYLSLPVQH